MAGSDRPADIHLEVVARNPERQLHPLADAVIHQELIRHPDDVGAVEQLIDK